jgi:uncharacterized membrane protein YtjA (UPF0391 family)
MLRAAMIFFVLGLLAYIFGSNEILGVSLNVGKLLLLVFLIFSFVSFVGGVSTSKTNN